MADSSIYLMPGMQAEITIPSFYVGQGYRKIEKLDGSTESKQLQNGFALADENVGEIVAKDGAPTITYTHKKFGQNRIYFFGRNKGETCVISVIAVDIHDHSSIVTGGPAYATYFTDSETQD